MVKGKGMTVAAKPIRVLVGKAGLDGHDRGVKLVARALRDAGMEVIYTGLHQTPEQVVSMAIQEDVDAIGLSMLSGSHKEIVAETVQCLEALDAGDIKIFVGGTIPADDHDGLIAAGVCGIYTAEMAVADVLSAIDKELAA